MLARCMAGRATTPATSPAARASAPPAFSAPSPTTPRPTAARTAGRVSQLRPEPWPFRLPPIHQSSRPCGDRPLLPARERRASALPAHDLHAQQQLGQPRELHALPNRPIRRRSRAGGVHAMRPRHLHRGIGPVQMHQLPRGRLLRGRRRRHEHGLAALQPRNVFCHCRRQQRCLLPELPCGQVPAGDGRRQRRRVQAL